MKKPLRIAFFPDSYLEVNGAAMTCQRLVRYAQRHDYPYFVVHAGKETKTWDEGSVRFLQLKRSPVSITMDEDLAFDPAFFRYKNRILKDILDFQPDVMHITGVNDVSNVAAYIAWQLQIPLLGSWHTNVHEFAAQRLGRALRFLPGKFAGKITNFAEKMIMKGAVLYYQMPKVVVSPNLELVEELGKGTGRISKLMGRGVDAEKFSPAKRTVDDGILRLGFVGRLRAEKNVRLLVDLEKELIKAGKTNFKFLIVGEGNEREHLEKNLQTAEFTGFLEGEKLSEAYANMDIFVFPSETDAFGNVAQEAAASGVVPIVSDRGGPKFLVKHGETGYVASAFDDYLKYAIELMDDPEKLKSMRSAARENALSSSWDSIFEGVYEAYDDAVRIAIERKAIADAKKAAKKGRK